MKKKIVSICIAAALAATAVIGGTLAYFTDEKEATNVFTVGNVAIELYESQLHRVNANTTDPTNPLWSDVDMKGEAKEYKSGKTFWTGACYTDDQIIEDAATYQDKYLANANIAPGTGYHKMPYVKNTGTNDAYVRIRVIIPTKLDELLGDSLYTGTALKEGFKEFTFVEKVVGDNKVYEFTRVEPLAPGEMTFWNVWGTITMDKDVTNEDITKMKEAKLISDTGEFKVWVEADAIQADGFNKSVEAAWAAFDA